MAAPDGDVPGGGTRVMATVPGADRRDTGGGQDRNDEHSRPRASSFTPSVLLDVIDSSLL
jgi:hypothetical protein